MYRYHARRSAGAGSASAPSSSEPWPVPRVGHLRADAGRHRQRGSLNSWRLRMYGFGIMLWVVIVDSVIPCISSSMSSSYSSSASSPRFRLHRGRRHQHSYHRRRLRIKPQSNPNAVATLRPSPCMARQPGAQPQLYLGCSWIQELS